MGVLSLDLCGGRDLVSVSGNYRLYDCELVGCRDCEKVSKRKAIRDIAFIEGVFCRGCIEEACMEVLGGHDLYDMTFKVPEEKLQEFRRALVEEDMNCSNSQ